MRLITILNHGTEYKRFVLEGSHVDAGDRIMVSVRPAKELQEGVQLVRSAVSHL